MQTKPIEFEYKGVVYVKASVMRDGMWIGINPQPKPGESTSVKVRSSEVRVLKPNS